MTKPIDEEVRLAMYEASKEASHPGGWFWAKAFAKALYKLSPSASVRIDLLTSQVKQLEGEAEESRTDLNYLRARFEEEKRRRQALETKIFDSFVAGVLTASDMPVEEARDLGHQYVTLITSQGEGK